MGIIFSQYFLCLFIFMYFIILMLIGGSIYFVLSLNALHYACKALWAVTVVLNVLYTVNK